MTPRTFRELAIGAVFRMAVNPRPGVNYTKVDASHALEHTALDCRRVWLYPASKITPFAKESIEE